MSALAVVGAALVAVGLAGEGWRVVRARPRRIAGRGGRAVARPARRVEPARCVVRAVRTPHGGDRCGRCEGGAFCYDLGDGGRVVLCRDNACGYERYVEGPVAQRA